MGPVVLHFVQQMALDGGSHEPWLLHMRLAKLSHAKARDLPLNELLKGPQHLSNTELALDDPHGTCGVAFCPTEGIGWGFSCTMAAALRNHQTVSGHAVMGW